MRTLTAIAGAVMAAGCLAAADASAAGITVCPPTISVETHIDPGAPLPRGAWSDPHRVTYKLTSVAMYQGVRGEELKPAPAELKPEQKEDGKKLIETFNIDLGGKSSFALCRYRGTEVTVGVDMPNGARSCTVSMAKQAGKSHKASGSAVMECK